MRYTITESYDSGPGERCTANFSFSANPEKCTSLDDVLNVLTIFRAACEGRCSIAGMPIGKPATRNSKLVGESEIGWLMKAREIEDTLDIRFDPAKIVLDNDSAMIIQDLYASLVNRLPVKEGISDASLELDESGLTVFEESVRDERGTQIALTFSRPVSYTLFGQEFTLQSSGGVFGLVADGIERRMDGTGTLLLKNPQGKADGFSAHILFGGKEQLDEFYESSSADEIMSALERAKTPGEYLDEEKSSASGNQIERHGT